MRSGSSGTSDANKSASTTSIGLGTLILSLCRGGAVPLLPLDPPSRSGRGAGGVGVPGFDRLGRRDVYRSRLALRLGLGGSSFDDDVAEEFGLLGADFALAAELEDGEQGDDDF